MQWLLAQFKALGTWLTQNTAVSAWLVVLSLVMSLGGLLVVRWLVLAIPHDYFTAPRQPGWRDRHPIVRACLIAGKNLIGAVLLVLGIAMLVAPGPGIVTVLLAVIFLDLPGKQALERRIVTLPSVLHTINRLRVRANRPALDMPPQN